jgi:predicted O-methyltransferase YrrM
MLAKKIIMYSSLTLLRKYLQYKINSSNGKGHGVHSPFVYTFIREVLNKKASHPKFNNIEQRRAELKQDATLVQVWDRGAGSRQTSQNTRSIRAIAKAALKPKKYSQLLYKIAAYYQPSAILEMGTSFGITTCYLSLANENAKVVTMEGAPNVAVIAKQTFEKLGIENVRIEEGDFNHTLPLYLASQASVGFAYVDGNHRYEPTIQYFNQLLEKSNDDSILIFDDIHWSAEMENAWEEIKQHPSVTLTIDLFFIGLVFVRKAQKEKEHFIISY